MEVYVGVLKRLWDDPSTFSPESTEDRIKTGSRTRQNNETSAYHLGCTCGQARSKSLGMKGFGLTRHEARKKNGLGTALRRPLMVPCKPACTVAKHCNSDSQSRITKQWFKALQRVKTRVCALRRPDITAFTESNAPAANNHQQHQQQKHQQQEHQQQKQLQSSP